MRGCYRALLAREQASAAKARRVPADPDNPSAGHFVRSSALLDALENGEPVVVPGARLPSGLGVPSWMRPGAGSASFWLVSADDVVSRAESPAVDRIKAPRRSTPRGGVLGH